MPMEAFEGGTLAVILVPEGGKVNVMFRDGPRVLAHRSG